MNYKNVRTAIYNSFLIFFLISNIFVSTMVLFNAQMSIEESPYNIDQKNSSIQSEDSVQRIPLSAGKYIESFNLSQISKIDEFGHLRSTIVVEDFAYLSDSDFGLRILNVENKSHPVVVGQYKNEGIACDVQVIGKYAYLANGIEGLEIIDISDPTQPKKIGGYKDGEVCSNIEVEGDRAFISSSSFPIKIINVSDLENPIKIGEITGDYSSSKFKVSGNFVFVPSKFDGLLIFNVLDVSNPDLISQYKGYYYFITDVDIIGNRAYVTGLSSYYTRDIFEILDISNPANLLKLGGIEGYNSPYDIQINGDLAYVNIVDGFNIYNLTNLSKLGSYKDNVTITNMFASENYVYITDFNIGLIIIDVSDPMNPNKIIELKEGEYLCDFIIEEHYIYLVDSAYGLKIIDISDPSNPNVIGGCNLKIVHGTIAIKGNYVYIDNGEDGLAVIDVSDPTNPSIVANYTGMEYIWNIEITRDYAFLIDSGEIMDILDISDPLYPIKINNYTSSSRLDLIKVYDEYGYLISSSGLIKILNLSDPTNPTLICNYQSKEYESLIDSNSYILGHQFVLNDSVAYLASMNYGLELIDMSDPKNPKHLGQFEKESSIRDVQIYENFTWIIDNEGIKILDTSNPRRISIIDQCNINVFKLKIIENNIYACSIYRISIFEYVYQKNSNPNWISGIPISWIIMIAGLGIMTQILKTQNHKNLRKIRE